MAKYDASVDQNAFDLVTKLKEKHGVDRLDTVVANAGIMTDSPLVKDVKTSGILKHLDMNTFAVVSLYQATCGLLEKSSSEPIFAPVGSGEGSLG